MMFDSDLDYYDWLNGPDPAEGDSPNPSPWDDEPDDFADTMLALDDATGEPTECERCHRPTHRQDPTFGWYECQRCAEARNEAAVERAYDEFYGSASPQTDGERAVQAHRDRHNA